MLPAAACAPGALHMTHKLSCLHAMTLVLNDMQHYVVRRQVQIILWNVPPHCKAGCRPQQRIHLLCCICAMPCAGRSASSCMLRCTPNLYSPHSYLGLTTLVLLALQVRLAHAPHAAQVSVPDFS